MTEIAGYRLQREIGRGGRSRVYLASHHAHVGPLAVKVTKLPIEDAAFDERFEQAGRAAETLVHPNIVRVLAFGKAEAGHYRVMEYVRGGDLARNLADGIHLKNLLMAMKDVAAALDYAHGVGVRHGDLRPGNLLFDEQGLVRVSGFASPARIDSEGPSPYSSPEVAAGQPPGASSDFYSLGVIFYEALTGRLPDAGTGSRGMVVRLHAPPLPLQFSVFRGVVERLLAKAPEERFENGLQLAAALDELGVRNAVPNAVIRTQAVTAREVEVAESAHVRERLAPAGDARGMRLLRPPAVAAAVVTIAAAAAAFGYVSAQGGWTRALAYLGLADHPDAVVAWELAEDLSQDRNQSLSAVVSAYRRVLAIDPSHAAAADAIDAAAGRWRDEVALALANAELGLADARLDELALAFPDDPELADLSGRLENQRQATELLANTTRLMARSGLTDVRSAEAAIASYKEVLRLDPDNEQAALALREIAVHYGAEAQRVANTDIAAARDNLRRALAADEGFAGAESVQATLQEAAGVQEQIEADLQEAAALRQAGVLIAPRDANPLHIYRRVLATDPDNPIAQQGVSEVSATALAQFDNQLREGSLEEARSYLDRAAAAGAGDELVNEMARRYDEELKRLDAAKALIARAEDLYRRGYVTGPDPEANAVALLREALRLDPNNSDGIRLLSVSATRLADVAREAYNVGMPAEALQYLDLALTVTPGIGRWRELRERWQAEVDRKGPDG